MYYVVALVIISLRYCSCHVVLDNICLLRGIIEGASLENVCSKTNLCLLLHTAYYYTGKCYLKENRKGTISWLFELYLS